MTHLVLGSSRRLSGTSWSIAFPGTTHRHLAHVTINTMDAYGKETSP